MNDINNINNKIILDHGSGGKISHNLISKLLVPIFKNDILSKLHDGAILDMSNKKIAFSTDSYVVDPIFFPGGNIGDLAINGTVNDIAMCGAKPVYISVGLIIEEGFLIKDLETILKAMQQAALKAQVQIVTGDTKVVPKGCVDKIFINTSGIGVIEHDLEISGNKALIGDKIILSGSLGNHGIAIFTQRESMDFDAEILSDTNCLNHLINKLLKISKNIHVLRDPTRGGLGTALNEIALASNIGIEIYEKSLPVDKKVLGVCELVGFDPLYIANEGKFIAFVASQDAELILEEIKKDNLGQNACMIGEVVENHKQMVIMQTQIGGKRIIDMLTGEQLPRIC